MHTHTPQDQAATMRLYDESNQRLYINRAERQRFLAAAQQAPAPMRQFALTLLYSGCRLSEARELTFGSLQSNIGVLSIRCLKKRHQHVMREVPVPRDLIEDIQSWQAERNAAPSEYIWPHHGHPIPRIAAYRWIKQVMKEAGITGAQACPKGLRHGFGVHATMSGVQLHMLQRWMGHTDIRTTAIYATVVGPDEVELARRMWGK